ncbi:hypothetical protein [Bradyrhizobium sp. 191]|uniref:hypothetical protein n=1 Tax=Bradyrhizobium sp. 191 TaxID=2782659 RepID=UPI001FFEE3B7|nr:hypothetical protein [Bradyrhizobium sp. 191]UPJ66913.1 hypothetical protein IVB23_05995 [Bradyrhizobium sp. 191]
MLVALEGRGFRGKLAEVECGARIGVSFGLTGSLIFECCGASRFAVQQAIAPQKSCRSRPEQSHPPMIVMQIRDGTAERNASRTNPIDPSPPPVA